MVGVGDQKRLLVEKHRLCFLERNAVLAPVLRILSVVPLETNHGHRGPVYVQCNENSTLRLSRGAGALTIQAIRRGPILGRRLQHPLASLGPAWRRDIYRCESNSVTHFGGCPMVSELRSGS